MCVLAAIIKLYTVSVSTGVIIIGNTLVSTPNIYVYAVEVCLHGFVSSHIHHYVHMCWTRGLIKKFKALSEISWSQNIKT